MTLTPTLRRRAWTLAIPALLLLPAAAFAGEPHWFAFEREIAAAGDSEAEATLALWEQRQHARESVDKALARAYSPFTPGRYLVQTVTNSPTTRGNRHFLAGAVRFLIFSSLNLEERFPDAARLQRSSVVEVAVWQSGGTASAGVRFTLEEAVWFIDANKIPEVSRVHCGLMRRAWNQVRSPEVGPLSVHDVEAAVRVPYKGKHLEFEIAPAHLNAMIGGDADPADVVPISDAEAAAFEAALDLLIDPATDPKLRRHLRSLRFGSMPLTSPRRKLTLRALLSPSSAPSRGLLGALGSQ